MQNKQTTEKKNKVEPILCHPSPPGNRPCPGVWLIHLVILHFPLASTHQLLIALILLILLKTYMVEFNSLEKYPLEEY